MTDNDHITSALLAEVIMIIIIYPYCFSAYSQSAFLYYGNDIILFQEGTQQSDPLGPLLFSNTIYPLLNRLSSNLQLGYSDDLTVGGPIDSVCRDVAEIREAGSFGSVCPVF